MIRIDEALDLAKANGRKVTKIGLGNILFPESNKYTVRTLMQNLTNGKTKRVEPKWCLQICEYCGCTLDFLFGVENKENF